MQLAGARVLLTGATGGIGQAIARTLHRAGAQLVLTGRRADVLTGLADEIGAEVIAADLGARAQLEALVTQAGRVDVLVANAALPGSGMLLDLAVSDIDRDLDVNLRAPIVLTRLLAPAMVDRGSGHISFVGSLSSLAASPTASMYAATKFGLRGFAHAARQDLHGTGVGVSIVLPGFIRDAGMFANAGATLPPGMRTCSPEQVGEGVLRSIVKNKTEIAVAPREMHLGALLGSVAPTMSGYLQRRFGARLANDVTEGHRRHAAAQREV